MLRSEAVKGAQCLPVCKALPSGLLRRDIRLCCPYVRCRGRGPTSCSGLRWAQHARCAGARNILSEDNKRLSELQRIRERDLGVGPMYDAGHFNANHARMATELATFVGIALRVKLSEESLRSALEAQETLAHEMSHRVKNLFALVRRGPVQKCDLTPSRHSLIVANQRLVAQANGFQERRSRHAGAGKARDGEARDARSGRR